MNVNKEPHPTPPFSTTHSKDTPSVHSFVLCVLCWSLGIWLASSLHWTHTTWWLQTTTFFLLWACFWFRRLPGQTLWLLSCFISLGALWAQLDRDNRTRQAQIPHQMLNRRAWFEGIVQAPAQRLPQTLRFPLQLTRFSTQATGPWLPAKGQLQLKILTHTTKHPTPHTTPPRIHFARGDRLRMYIKIRPLRWYGMPGVRDTRAHYARRGIAHQSTVRSARVMRLDNLYGPNLRHTFSLWREHLARWVDANITHPNSSAIVRSLILGDRSGLTPTLRRQFSRTGTSHLLAISGLHLAIVTSLVFFLCLSLFSHTRWLILRFDIHRLAALCTLPCAILYTLLSGASLSTCRALIMVTLVLLSLSLQREPALSLSLAWAAFLILLWNPSALFELSFQLSFVAVISLAWGATSLSQTLQAHLPWRHADTKLTRLAGTILGMWCASCVATLGTLPLTLSFSNEVPIGGPWFNLIAVPIGGYAVVGCGLLALFLLPLSDTLARCCLWCSDHAAQLLAAFVDCSSRPDWITWTMNPLRPAECWAYYIALLGALSFFKWRRLALCCLFLSFSLFSLQQEKLHTTPPMLELHFLDIGQGDATFIRFPQGQTMLIDAGGEPFVPFDVGQQVLLPYFRWLHLDRLDFAVLSHPHPDHFGGFPSVFARLPPREFWHNAEPSKNTKYRQFHALLKQHHTRMRVFPTPERFKIGPVQVEILSPFPGPYEGNTYYWALHANDNSLVIRLTYGKIRVLLTGDIEKRAEQLLSQRWRDLGADLLKVPHHGSRTSSTALLLDRVKPRHAVICLGRANIFKFPHPEVMERYQNRNIQLWRTDKHGLVRALIDGKTLRFETHLNTPADNTSQ